MTKQTSNSNHSPARALFAAVALSPFLFNSCLSKSDKETIEVPALVGDAAETATAPAPLELESAATTPPPTETTPTPAAPAKPTPPPYALDSAEKYVVQPGDSLSVIAAKNNVSMGDVMRANKIKNANKIRIGQTLLLPGKEAPAATEEASAVTETAAEGTAPESSTTSDSGDGSLTLPGF